MSCQIVFRFICVASTGIPATTELIALTAFFYTTIIHLIVWPTPYMLGIKNNFNQKNCSVFKNKYCSST